MNKSSSIKNLNERLLQFAIDDHTSKMKKGSSSSNNDFGVLVS